MKHLLFSFRLIVLVITLMQGTGIVMGSDFLHEGFYYNKISDTEVELQGIDYLAYGTIHPSVGGMYYLYIPGEFSYGGHHYTVTKIATYAFYNHNNIKYVYIPPTIKFIGTGAFDCPNLEKVEISDIAAWCKINFDYLRMDEYGNYWVNYSGEYGQDTYYGGNPLEFAHHLFLNGEEVVNLVLPESLDTISAGAFYGCTGLKTVNTGNGVKYIGGGAFDFCDSLTEVTVGTSVRNMGIIYHWYDGRLPAIPGNWSPFAYTVTRLVWNARSCESYPFGMMVGDGNPNVEQIILGEEVETIPDHFANNMRSISEITIPNSVTSIGISAFCNCMGLTSVTIGNSVTEIPQGCFYYCIGLTSVTIPNSVVSIDNQAFGDCIGLTSVTIGNSVTSIGDDAFCDCIGLTSVTIPNSVVSIGRDAFYGCSGLTSVTIGNSVTSIGGGAFRGCSGLTSVTCLAETPPSVDDDYDAFDNYYVSPTLYVPAESLNAYKTTYPWFMFNIQPIPAEGGAGDVNGDGNINIDDVTALINHLLKQTPVDGNADVDGNGNANIEDVTTLINMLLHRTH